MNWSELFRCLTLALLAGGGFGKVFEALGGDPDVWGTPQSHALGGAVCMLIAELIRRWHHDDRKKPPMY